MTSTDDSVCTIGIDVGSSGIRLLLLDRAGTKLSEQIATYNALKKQSYLIWDNEKRINVTTLKNIVENQLYTLLKDWPNINVYSLSISSIGPSLVLLSKEAQPLTHAFTYAYQGAQDYVKFLPSNFQERTGSLYSGALPYVQLLKIKESSFSSCFKITTINDYLTWSLTDLPLEKIFSTVPNASYTGLYSLEHRNWDEKLLQNLDLELSILPEIIPMGTVFPIKDKFKQLLDNFRNTYIVTGTIDGIDAFWATGVDSEDILIGSASSTGAFRRMRKSPKSKYRSRLIQMCQIDDNKWVELIPFNNVGTSFVWVGKNFKVAFKNFITESNNVNIERLEKEALQKLEDIAADLESYFLKIPLYFPYIEGEPRGPNGRGRVKGGFIIIRENSINCIDLYISLIIGIVNMYKHNLEVLDTPDNYNEIRLTGLIARKSRLFLRFLASLVNKKVVIMKTKQSVAWATGMRALTYLGVLEEMPPVTTLDPILPEDNKLKKILTTLYRRYMEVYQTPDNYQIIQSEEEID